MILVTHEIIGGALAVATKTGPTGAFLIGLASHYVFDMIPHWHYKVVAGDPFRAWSERGGAFLKKFITGAGAKSFLKIFFDGASGLFLLYLVARPETISEALPIFMGAFGGALPDLLSPLARILPNRILNFHQYVHLNIIHTKILLDYKPFIGISSQVFIAGLGLWIAFVFR